MNKKEYKFLVSMCGGWCNGTISFYAEDEDEAYGKAMDYIGDKLSDMFPELDILYSVELYEEEGKENIEDDPEYGRCSTCRYYGNGNICSYCIEGSEYEYRK